MHSTPGRIWIKWNVATVDFKPEFTSKQLIHGIIYVATIPICVVTTVYAANSLVDRQLLWKQIQDIAVNINLPWAIIGDFNCCRSPLEKAVGTLLTNSKLGDFNSMIFNTGMHDLSFVGHYYTWHN
ncbi:hypothetical protein M5K25_012511 [Dendrobium thyrsiflorum]|uniref:Endonuclease/exonuclease/phosphatase domain-containing protein n=1 Tax=Dendrobium thyrsiflorum TaxID=117978 RepID=A0ABD0UY39_DENTH